MEPGTQLKKLRDRLGLTVRKVEEESRLIANTEGNEEYYVSHAWLTALEKTHVVPSIYKLFSLSLIYRAKFSDLLLLYGVDLDCVSKYQMARYLEKTHLMARGVYETTRAVSFPVRFDRAARPEETALLSRIVEVWGEVPIEFLQHLDLRNSLYGYIGLEDYTLYPLLRPGSFVQIDPKQNKISELPWRTELDRPIYFIELHKGYACSWCDLQANRLFLVPHPLSLCKIRQFGYPAEAEIVGRVTAFALRLVDYGKSGAFEPGKLA